MSAPKKPCARRLGLLCFPVSTALCAAAFWAPAPAQAEGFVLSPRGAQPGDDSPVPYEPYEDGNPSDRAVPPANQDNGDDAGENPGSKDSAKNSAPSAQDPAQQPPQGEEEIQYDEAPPANSTTGQADAAPAPTQGEAQDDTSAGQGDGEDAGEEMQFDEPAESAGEGEDAGEEMQFGEPTEGGDQTAAEGVDEAEGEEMQFGAEPPADADSGEDEGEGGFVFEDISDDEEALAEELQAGQKQAKGVVGTVRGLITGSDGQEVMGAYVETKDKKYIARSGVDGTFELKLNPGVYTLRVYNDGYNERLFEGVEVKARESVTLDASITPLPGAVQTMIIEEEVAKEGNIGQAIKRQKARATRDIMSREEMSKSGGSSTSSVARRIVGSTVVGGRYIFVRGLGHRYGNTLLDGARVPSPDPDLRTVPLDIFPTSALSAINVQKTFTPDVPADFTGGSVQLETRDIPERFTFNVGASIGMNTETTFRQQLSSRGVKGADAFGFGNIRRGLTKEIEDSPGRLQPQFDRKKGDYVPPLLPEVIEAQVEKLFLDTLIRTNTFAPMNVNGKLNIGNSWKIRERSRLGLFFGGGYSSSRSTRRGISRLYLFETKGEDTTLLEDEPTVDYKTFTTAHRVGFNGIGLAKLKIDDYNKASLTALYSRDSINRLRRNSGTATVVRSGVPIVSDRLRYTMRSLLQTQLAGQHTFPRAKSLKLDWFGSYAQARQDDPAIRNIVYWDKTKTNEGLPIVKDERPIGVNYLDLVDDTGGGALNLTLPFRQWADLESLVKIGGWFEAKDRTFLARNFETRVRSVPGAAQIVVSKNGLVDNFLTPEMIGNQRVGTPGPIQPLLLEEATSNIDSYVGVQTVVAAYALLDIPLHRRLKLTGGTRFERSFIRVSPRLGIPLEKLPEKEREQHKKLTSRLTDTRFFPSVGLSFALKDNMNLRLSGTQTIARPELRELAPFTFSDFVGGVDVQGYPKLKSTLIWNADLRWEWFPNPSEVVSASVFFKYLDGPVEKVMSGRPEQGLASFRNVLSATNIGFELETRKNLEFIWHHLKPVTIGANFAYVHSRVRLPEPIVCDRPDLDKSSEEYRDCQFEAFFDSSTSRERPLQGQSPFVLNAFLDLNFKKTGTGLRVLFNSFGRRIARIGGAGLPDTYEESFPGLDAQFEQAIYREEEKVDEDGNISSPAKALKFKFSVSNILNSKRSLTQGKQKAPITNYRPGANISMGLSWGF